MEIETETAWLNDFPVKDQKATENIFLFSAFWKIVQNSEIKSAQQSCAVASQTREMYSRDWSDGYWS